MSKSKNVFDLFTEQNILAHPYKELKKSLQAHSLSEKGAFADASTDIEPYRPAKQLLRNLVGKQGDIIETIGPHPDFSFLDSDDKIYHYIVSVFVDIKGSTKLAATLPLEEVRFIKNGLLVTAIDIFQAFDGHVHRLQGDALFAFFGGKSVSKSDAIVDALNATSTLQYYVKNNLSILFTKMDLPTIRIRIGIDFGDDQKVLWTKYGIQNTSEITTTSVHTDLAAKLQSKAPSNKIMIGDNIVTYLDLPDEFYGAKKIQQNGESVEEPYVMRNEFMTYRMWVFDWERYYAQCEFAQTNDSSVRSPNNFSLSCMYRTPTQEVWTGYRANCGAVPKGLSLRFDAGIPPWLRYDDIVWGVENFGTEATEANAVRYEMEKYRGKIYCFQATAYRGHHYMHCTLKHQGRAVAKQSFPLFISCDKVEDEKDG